MNSFSWVVDGYQETAYPTNEKTTSFSKVTWEGILVSSRRVKFVMYNELLVMSVYRVNISIHIFNSDSPSSW